MTEDPDYSQLPPPPPVDPKAAKKAEREAKKADRQAKTAERRAKYKAREANRKEKYAASKAKLETERAQVRAAFAESKAQRAESKAQAAVAAAERKAEREADAAEHHERMAAMKAELDARKEIRDTERAEASARRDAAREEKDRSRTEKTLASKPKYMKDEASGFGVTVKKGEVRHGRDRGPLPGVTARVETAGEIRDRFTMTRLALLGPFGLALKKKKDKRELYLTVEGEGFAFVEEINPDKGAKARRFAAELTGLGSKAAAEERARGTARATLDAPPIHTAPAVAPAPTAPAGPDMAGQLANLAELHQAGALTDDEFSAAKARLLG